MWSKAPEQLVLYNQLLLNSDEHDGRSDYRMKLRKENKTGRGAKCQIFDSKIGLILFFFYAINQIYL